MRENQRNLVDAIRKRAQINPRAKFLVVAVGAGLTAACGGTKPRETSRTTTPEAGTIKDEKVGAWDRIIEAYIERNLQSQKQIKDDWENGRKFFAIEARYDRRPPFEMRAAVVLPLSDYLPKPSNDYNSTVYYAIGRRDRSLTPFPKGSNISFLKFTPSAKLNRQVLDEADELLVNKNVTVVQTRVLEPGSQGRLEPGLGIVLLDGTVPQRTDAFLQEVRDGLLRQKPPLILEVTDGAPLVLQHFPAKVIEKDGKLIYTRSDPTA